MVDEQCPFKWGDRISHKLFGFGTVNGEPTAVVGADASLRKVVPRGWSVPVEWDDKSRTAGRVDSNFLEKVSSPTAKGAHYWNHEWKKLKNTLTEARAQTEALLSNSFRSTPPFKPENLAALLAGEQKALAELTEFLRRDAAGEHE